MVSSPLTLDFPDPAATTAFGHRLGKLLFPGAVVALIGPLGAGKTYLVRAIAEALGIADSRTVCSPTFVLIHEYGGRLPIYHFDAYRVGPSEFSELGSHEYFESAGVCLVEWADRVLESLPLELLAVTLKITGPTSRQANVEARGQRYMELADRMRSAE